MYTERDSGQARNDNPIFIETIKKIVAAANKYGKATGILFFNPDDYKKYYDLGIKFIACGADATFVMNGATEMVKKLSKSRQEKS